MRCPYCRLVMPDGSTRCLRCAAVVDDGRWVRGRAPTSPPPTTSSTPRPVPPPAVGPDRDATPAGGPVHPAEPAKGRGCAIGAALAVVLVVVALTGTLLAGRGPDEPAGPSWSEAYAAAFLASCAGEGRDAGACRCLRGALERSFAEDEMRELREKLAKGRRLTADEENELLAAERRCA